MTDIKNVKIQTRKAVTEEGGAELPAATDLCGVQVAWEFKPSRESDSSKASRAFVGVKNEFQNNPRRRLKFPPFNKCSAARSMPTKNGAKNGNDEHHLKSQPGLFVAFPVMSMAKVHHWCLRGPMFPEHLET